MEELRSTYLIGPDSKMTITSLSTGRYVVTVLPLLHEPPLSGSSSSSSAHEIFGSSAVHAEYVVISTSLGTCKTLL